MRSTLLPVLEILGQLLLIRYQKAAKYFKKHRTLGRNLVFAGLFGFFWALSFQRLDLDFGWHLQTGNYILAHGIPGHDIYSYTARNFQWIDHEWANDVLVSILYNHLGYWAIATLYAGLWTAALAIIGWRVRLSVLLMAALAITTYAGSRPLAWTVLFFAITLAILRAKRVKLLYWLPPLFIIWANLHAGFIAALVAIAYFAIRERRKHLFLILLLCVVATMINVYGPRIYEEIFRTLLDPSVHSRVQEWFSFSIFPQAYPFLYLWLAGFVILVLIDKRDWKQLFGLNTFLLAAALSATRNVPFFVVGAIDDLDRYADQAIKAVPKRLDASRQAVLGLFIIALAFFFCNPLLATINDLRVARESIYPAAAVAYLRQHPCDGNLFNGYDAGGYLIWKLPNQPVYIDGRMPTWEPYMDNYERVLAKPAAYRQEFARYHITCALIRNDRDSQKLLKILHKDHWRTVNQASNGWRLLVEPT